MKKEENCDLLPRMRTYEVIYNLKKSTAKRVANSRQKLTEKLKTKVVLIQYGPKRETKKIVRGTTMGHEELQNQAPGSALFRVYDVDNRCICPIPTEYTIEEVAE